MAGETTIRASKGAAQRLANAIRAIEGAPRDTAGQPSGRLGGGGREFWAEIGDSASISDNRWKYAWVEQRRTATGFEELPDGRSGTTTTGYAINAAEANNATGGIQGNGIDHDDADYPSGFALKPIRGTPVRRMYVDFLEDGTAVYTFEASNAEQGPCDGGA